MKLRIFVALSLICIICSFISAQDAGDKLGFEKKHHVGTQVFMILTPILDPSPEYFQLNYGYRFSSKDELSIEAITWRYSGPLGRPFGPDYESPDSEYPGDVKSLGVGVAYKRFLWKGVYTHLHATAFRQNYRNERKEKIQSGFMLFNTLRLGYHFKLFKNRIFLAPSIGTTFWPINTNVPASFQIEEDRWPKYFLGEFGLHVGFNF